MARLKLAMINSIHPMAGAGDGVTEYAYRMQLNLSKNAQIDQVYAIEEAKKNDVLGLVRVNALLSRRVSSAAKKDYDIFHIMNQEVGFTAKDVKRVSHLNKVITTIHDIARLEGGLHLGTAQKIYNHMVGHSVATAVEKSDYLIFNSSQTMKKVKKRFGFSNGKVINIGIDSRFSVKPIRKTHKNFSVGYLGSFAYHKNVSMLLESATGLKEDRIQFLIYGDGAEKKKLREFAEIKHLKKVNFMGFAPESKKIDIYDSFDVFAFPSKYEGFGLPILEAQSRGLPVIIYKHGEIPEEVARYCLRAEDSAHMAQIIKEIEKEGYDKGRRLKAMRYARSFTWKRCALETLKIYEKTSDKKIIS